MRRTLCILIIVCLSASLLVNVDADSESIVFDEKTITHYQSFHHFSVRDIGYMTRLSIYAFLSPLDAEILNDAGLERAGEFEYNTTHLTHLSFNVTACEYVNWSTYPHVLTPFNLSRISFTFHDIGNYSRNVGAGYFFEMFNSSEIGATEDVIFNFQFTRYPANYSDYFDYLVALNVTADFVTTYSLREYVLWGCIQEPDDLAAVILILLVLVLVAAFPCISRRTKRVSKKEAEQMNEGKMNRIRALREEIAHATDPSHLCQLYALLEKAEAEQ